MFKGFKDFYGVRGNQGTSGYHLDSSYFRFIAFVPYNPWILRLVTGILEMSDSESVKIRDLNSPK